MSYQEEDVLLCTVKGAEKTSVFLELPDGSEGTMMLSEVAAGRIRNLREYITPNKKVVCKVMRITGKHIELSLRRVTGKERETVLDRYKRERMYLSILSSLSKEPEKLRIEIEKQGDLVDLFDEAREHPEKLKDILPKEIAEKVLQSIEEKQERVKRAKTTITLSTSSPNGVEDLKEVLSNLPVEAHYLGSSKFLIEKAGPNPKELNAQLAEVLKTIQTRAQKLKVAFSQEQIKKQH